MVVFGLGFNFGNLPSYAPGSENDAREDEPPPQKKPAAPAPALPNGNEPSPSAT